MSKPSIIIQARTGSTRMPEKMIKEFHEGKSILDILLERLKHEQHTHDYLDKIIVATTDNPKDDAIEAICKKHSVELFRGSENDVLQRFIDAAEAYEINDIIRICADNVFLDMKALKTLANWVNNSFDYVSFRHSNGTPSIKTHFGFFAERVTLSALKKVASLTDESLYHEHVTNYIYQPENDFRTFFIPIENEIPGIEQHKNLRLTIDTESDFKLAQDIYAALIKRHPILRPESIFEYLKHNPKHYKVMEKNIAQNSK